MPRYGVRKTNGDPMKPWAVFDLDAPTLRCVGRFTSEGRAKTRAWVMNGQTRNEEQRLNMKEKRRAAPNEFGDQL